MATFIVRVVSLRFFGIINNYEKYVEVTIGSQTLTSNWGYNEWNQDLIYDTSDFEDNNNINITIYQKGFIANSIIGNKTLKYATYAYTPINLSLTHWYNIPIENGKMELGLIMGYKDDNLLEPINDILLMTKNNNEIVKRMLKQTEEIKQIALQNTETLSIQNDSVNQINNDLNDIRLDLIDADKSIDRIDSCWVMFFRRKKKTCKN